MSKRGSADVKLSGSWTFGALILPALWIPLVAQQRYLPSDVENGSRLYRTNCFACHGPEGNSIPGVDFRRGQFKHASTDDDLLRVIGSGVPGTAMPPAAINDSARLALVAYLRSMHEAATGPGDGAKGRILFEAKGGCLVCHRVNGNGSRLGPDLSEEGTIRTPDYLKRKILTPAESIMPEHRFVRVLTREGKVVTGLRLNEDTHTVQLIDQDERLRSFSKSLPTRLPAQIRRLPTPAVCNTASDIMTTRGLRWELPANGSH